MKQGQPLRGRYDVEEISSADEVATASVLRPVRDLDASQLDVAQAIDDEPPNIPQVERAPKGGSIRAGLLLLLAVIGLGLIEVGLFVSSALQMGDWLGLVWLVLLAAGVVWAGRLVWREWRGLRQLKRQQHTQREALALYQGPSIGQGKRFCQTVAADLPQLPDSHLAAWQDAVSEHHNDSEVLALFEKLALRPVDQTAVRIVSGHAKAAGAMIAVSPFALLDMAIVLWRNLRMIDQICRLYGMQLSYFGRIKLIRSVFKTMLVAGATEILADAGGYALGSSVTGKLSSRVAQGLGAGVMTARIGVKAMQNCRPVPFVQNKQPSLHGMSQQLLQELKKLLG